MSRTVTTISVDAIRPGMTVRKYDSHDWGTFQRWTDIVQNRRGVWAKMVLTDGPNEWKIEVWMGDEVQLLNADE